MEFCSQESKIQAKNDDADWYKNLKPHAEIVELLLAGMALLVDRFPGVQFAVPNEVEIANDRPAAWAFVPDGLLTEEQREELGIALSSL